MTTRTPAGSALVGERPADPPGAQAALWLATAAFAVCFYGWSLMGPLGPDLQEQLGLSDVQLSIVVAVPVVFGSLARIPLGSLTDRLGGRRVFAWLMLFGILPLVALTFWRSSLGVVLVLGLLLGFSGASFAVGVPFVSRWFRPERQGFALGIYGAGTAGTVLAGLTGPALADAFGLGAPFAVAAVALVLMLAVWLLRAREAPAPVAPPEGSPAPAPGRGIWEVFATEGRARALTLFYFVSFGGFVSLFLYLPKLLTGIHELSKTDAGARAAGFAALAVIARPIGGVLADRIGAERVLWFSFVGTGLLAFVLAASYEHMLPLTVACLALGIALGLGTGAVFKLVAAWFPREVGGVTGVVGAAGGLGGFFPPLVMGAVMSATGGYALGFVLLGVVALLAQVALWRTSARHGRAGHGHGHGHGSHGFRLGHHGERGHGADG
jgi:NNP family nitrate/nitrite transporter-like MFS transporter